MNRNEKNVNKLTMLGMMTALVFVSNYLRITMPIAIGGRTSFTLANIMCCLSGLLLGPVGGFASGLGSAIYDLTNPAYAPECWITFLTKGVMGMVAGLAMKDRETPAYGRCTVSAALGCVAYYILYFFKSFAYDGLLMGGLTASVAAAAWSKTRQTSGRSTPTASCSLSTGRWKICWWAAEGPFPPAPRP